MALLAPSPRVLCRELCVVREAAAAPHPSSAAACSTVGGVAGRALWLWSGGAGRGRGRGVRAEAYFWDVSRPVEMEEIDSMDKLDDALRWSVENKQPVVIDWMASWCRKCIYLKPRLEKIAGEYPGVRFYFVDVNKVPQAVVKRGNITKMPTIQLWKDGEWKAEVIGGHKAWLVMDEALQLILTVSPAARRRRRRRRGLVGADGDVGERRQHAPHAHGPHRPEALGPQLVVLVEDVRRLAEDQVDQPLDEHEHGHLGECVAELRRDEGRFHGYRWRQETCKCVYARNGS